MPRVQHASLFYGSKRVATMQKTTYSIKTNDGQEVCDDGVYNTDGTVLTEVSCDALVPLPGVGISVVEDAINHRDVDLTIGVVDGKLHVLKAARNNDIEFDTTVADGKLNGKFKWHAGKPAITNL